MAERNAEGGLKMTLSADTVARVMAVVKRDPISSLEEYRNFAVDYVAGCQKFDVDHVALLRKCQDLFQKRDAASGDERRKLHKQLEAAEDDLDQLRNRQEIKLKKQREESTSLRCLAAKEIMAPLLSRTGLATISKAWVLDSVSHYYRLAPVLLIVPVSTKDATVSITCIPTPQVYMPGEFHMNMSAYLGDMTNVHCFSFVPYMTGIPEADQRAILFALNRDIVRFVSNY